MKRWQGLVKLVGDAVEHGSTAIEKVHKATAARTFTVLEAIPVVATPSKVVHVVHDASVSMAYGSVRLVNKAVTTVASAAIERLGPEPETGGEPPA